MRSTRLPVPFLAVMAGLALASCGATPGPTNPVANPSANRVSIAMVTHGQAADPFWAQVQKGAEQAATDFNVDLRYSSPPTTDPQAQAKLITDAAAQKPAAMVVTIPDPATLTAPIKQASAAGIPVIVANVGLNQLDQVGGLTFVGQPDQLAGQEAGTVMAAAGPRHALCVIHEADNTALTDRCTGFGGQLTKAGGTSRVLQVNGSDQPGAQAAIAAALTQDPAIDSVLATGIQGFAAASAAVKGLNAGGRIKRRHVRRLGRQPERPRGGAERRGPVRRRPAAVPAGLRRRADRRRSRPGSASTRSGRSTPGRAW